MSYAVAAGLAVASLATPAAAAELTGAGATFPFPIYAKWAEAYNKETGNRMNYQSIGSSGGIRQIRAKTVDFGATDAPLKGEELQKDGFVQFPSVMGGVVPVINLQGVSAGQLKLTGETLADIYNGKITKWNDPKIAQINAGLKLPDATITPVYRSDGSGTTSIFTTYLSESSASWKSGPGTGASVQWPIGQGGKGNEGVAALVKQVPNAIGYVEYAYAKQNSIPVAQLQNKSGKFVSPEAKTFQAAAANADWKSQPGYGVILANQPGDTSWPMTAATWILMHKQPQDAAASKEALKFFAWSYKNGAKAADELHYVPMPANVIADVQKTWAAEIKN